MTVITTDEIREVLRSAFELRAPVAAPLCLERFDALAADANRFAALRLVMTEPDPALREKFFGVFDQMTPYGKDDPITPERVNEVFDTVFAACAKLRVESNPL